jgi:dihydrofolate reductase
MIAAVAENGVIGAGDRIPWRIPSDMAHFKRTTMGKPLIMGRKQFEIFGKPLPGRYNIVVTRRPDYRPEGVEVCHDLVTAIARAKAVAEAQGVGEAMVIGGGEIYAQAMPRADRLYISRVALSPEGDVTFPTIDPALWRIAETPPVEASPKDEASYVVQVYERLRPGAH